MKKQVVLFGDTNAGKSSLFNALLSQKRAIVSDIPGTTADPVLKAMELLPYGPVTLVDTAGFDAAGETDPAGRLQLLREQKTRRFLDTADLALYVIDPGHFDASRYAEMTTCFAERELPYLTVLTKADLYLENGGKAVLSPEAAGNRLPAELAAFKPLTEAFASGKAFFHVSINNSNSVDILRRAIAESLQTETREEPSLIEGLLCDGDLAMLVVPLDSEAPAGRLILPQTQLIRACLDNGIRCHVTSDVQLPQALQDVKRADLVVTDSQAFAAADRAVPPEIPLTSFSILTARQKGRFDGLLNGTRSLGGLRDGDPVLIAEACTHNTSHEDIGRVKLPAAIIRKTGVKPHFTFSMGREFPDDVSAFRLVIHCGGCMLTRRAFLARQNAAERQGVCFTNYGLALAYCCNILERSVAAIAKQ